MLLVNSFKKTETILMEGNIVVICIYNDSVKFEVVQPWLSR